MYWIHWSETVFRNQIAVLRSVIQKRVLPTFASIEGEADMISNETWHRLNAAAGADSDPAMAAEAAQDAGVNHYLALCDAQQGLLNLFCVALYHMVEQQMLIVLRQELNPQSAPESWKLCEFVKRLATLDINVRNFTSWADFEELQLVANAAKHAEGASAKNLRRVRPEIFDGQSILETGKPFIQGPTAWLFQPLAGQDLYVTIRDLERYFNAADTFWQEFADALTIKAQQRGPQ
jgi:hypothetical protein